MLNRLPKIGISVGDINGVGPEIIVKALNNSFILSQCTPIVYAPQHVLEDTIKQLKPKNVALRPINAVEEAEEGFAYVLTTATDQNVQTNIGEATQEAGTISFQSLKRVTKDLVAGKIDAMVTAPINKQNIQSKDFQFPGHTGYITEMAGVKDNLMMMVSKELKVGLVTDHIPLDQVTKAITYELLEIKYQILRNTLINDFGIENPKIGLLGINPHAGDNGVIGSSDNDILIPFIAQQQEKGELVDGPFGTDGFFGAHAYKVYDGILGMYHDQVLTPFKLLHFDTGVNYTGGLPVVRTSPDHGTAYGIAGKGIANEGSFTAALQMAVEIIGKRSKRN